MVLGFCSCERERYQGLIDGEIAGEQQRWRRSQESNSGGGDGRRERLFREGLFSCSTSGGGDRRRALFGGGGEIGLCRNKLGVDRTMDKDWVHFDRSTDKYMHAALNFVEMTNRNTGNLEKILCPCKCCRNLTHHTGKDVYEHLVINGMDHIYTTWFHHGEEPTAAQKPKQVEMLEAHNLDNATYARDADHLEPLDEAKEDNFAKDLEDEETPLYLGCKNYTKLSEIVTLYKIKAESGWSDESFTKLLNCVIRKLMLV
ncbi:hypothetical protein Vadar_024673 [Vaccinium darrowii]|uniref:Uncharacterized protein n=1 Tax=Vaccinium darrowii TaxID=229202 RepID=A0ACB7YFU0_9ERIC|nr:hypothetical protein Vadar_024673 [Vaccinium darrowii]